MGAIIAIVMLAGRSMAPVGQLAFLMTRGRQAITTMASIQQMIEAGDERRMGSSALNLTIDAGNVSVEGLSFTYPGPAAPAPTDKIGRGSCRERVCQKVYISVGAGSLKKKITKKQ